MALVLCLIWTDPFSSVHTKLYFNFTLLVHTLDAAFLHKNLLSTHKKFRRCVVSG